MKKIKKLYLFVILCVLMVSCLVFGAACSKKSESDPSSSSAPADGEATAIEITGAPTESVYYQSGGVIVLDCEVTPADALVVVEWSTSDKNVATVRNGRVTHRGVGTVTITATIKDTTISDTCEITLVEQPALSINVDGTAVEVGYRIDGKGIEYAVLDLDSTDTDGKTLTFDTSGEEIINPLLTATFATGEGLETDTLYEMSYTLTFAAGSYNTIPKMSAGLRNNTSDDWYHTAYWNEGQIVYDAPMDFRVLFTTPSEQLDKVELLVIGVGSTYSWKGGLTIADVEIKKVDNTQVSHYIENKSVYKFIYFEGDEVYGTENPEAKQFSMTSGLSHATDSTYFHHSGIRRIWTVSDPDILEVPNANNGTFIVKAKGEVTVTSTIFGVENLSDSVTILIGDEEPEALKLQMKRNGETVGADIHMIEGANDFVDALTVSADETKLTIDTSVLGVSYKWWSLQLKFAEGEELKDDTLYYVSYTLKIVSLTDPATDLRFSVGANNASTNRISYWAEPVPQDGIFQVKGIFATGKVGVTSGYTDNSFMYLYGNSDENNTLAGFKAEITDLVLEEAEASTSGQKGNTGLGNIYSLIGWQTYTAGTTDFTFAKNAPVFLPTNIYDEAYPETIVSGVKCCGGLTYRWASSDTTVVNFTDAAAGKADLLTAGNTTISLYAVLPDGGEYLLCARDITVSAAE